MFVISEHHYNYSFINTVSFTYFLVKSEPFNYQYSKSGTRVRALSILKSIVAI